MESRDLEMGERMSNNKTMVDIIPEVYEKIRVPGVVVFDMPNSYQYDILSISIFCKIPLSMSILISISILMYSRIAILNERYQYL